MGTYAAIREKKVTNATPIGNLNPQIWYVQLKTLECSSFGTQTYLTQVAFLVYTFKL